MANLRDYYLIALPLAVIYLILALAVGVIKLMTLNGMLASPPLKFLFPHHGELMVFGFLATLIPVERYIGSRSMKIPEPIHAMPFLTSLGALLKIISWLTGIAVLNTLGTASVAVGALLYIYLLTYLSKLSSEKTSFRLMGAGAMALVLALATSLFVVTVGNLPLALLMLSFPALTILGERVELSKFTMRKVGIEALAAGVFAILGILLALVAKKYVLLLPSSLLLILLAAHIARSEKFAFTGGIKGYLSWHLAAAYTWAFFGLSFAALSTVAQSPQAYFDPAVHAIAIGFVFGMIYAHAPVVVPAVLGVRLSDTKLSLVPLAILSLSNVMRVLGKLANASPLVGLSGIIAVLSLLALAWMMLDASRT